MKRTGLLFIFSVLSLVSCNVFAGDASIKSERGPFSVTPFVGQRWNRLLNADGTYSGYQGIQYGAKIGINLYSSNDSAVDIFAEYNMSNTNNSVTTTEELKRTENIYGLNFYYSSWGFAGMGYGSATSTVKDTGYSSTFKNDFLTAGLGFDFYQFGNFQVSLQAWYKNGFVSKEENPDSLDNGGHDSTEVLLGLRWAPAMLSVSTGK